MRWLAPVAVLVGLLVMLAILGLSASLPVGALAIFSAGVLSGRLANRNRVVRDLAGCERTDWATAAAMLAVLRSGTGVSRSSRR